MIFGKKTLMAAAALIGGLMVLLAAQNTVQAELKVGEPAPQFVGKDSAGNEHSLESFKGKIVVLEWLNHECPFVKKHYNPGNMQALQKKYTEAGVVWLSVVSSAPGKQGYVDGPVADKLTAEKEAVPTAVLLDPAGQVGRLYGAKTTPHMFIIDAEGVLRYQGAIDSISSFRENDIAKAENYVGAALDALLAGKEVANHTTTSYGCSVKYE